MSMEPIEYKFGVEDDDSAYTDPIEYKFWVEDDDSAYTDHYSLEAESLEEAQRRASIRSGLSKEKASRLTIWGEKIDRYGRIVFCELVYRQSGGPWRLKRQSKGDCGPLRFKR